MFLFVYTEHTKTLNVSRMQEKYFLEFTSEYAQGILCIHIAPKCSKNKHSILHLYQQYHIMKCDNSKKDNDNTQFLKAIITSWHAQHFHHIVHVVLLHL